MEVNNHPRTIYHLRYTYSEACDDMKSTNWLLCHVHAYEYFGDVTRLLIPDNLKTNVISNTKYDTILNRRSHEMADYYDTDIVPARVLHPKDKSLAEGTVKFATTWIIAALRNRKFFSFEKVRIAVAKKNRKVKSFPVQEKGGMPPQCLYRRKKSISEAASLNPL